jgi:hypothetical protein
MLNDFIIFVIQNAIFQKYINHYIFLFLSLNKSNSIFSDEREGSVAFAGPRSFQLQTFSFQVGLLRSGPVMYGLLRSG